MTYKTEIKEDENGQYIILDQELLDQLNWNEHTILSIDCTDNGNIVLKKKTNWKVNELGENDNLDKVMEDIKFNNTTHTIIDETGKEFKLIPYDDYKEATDMISQTKHDMFLKELFDLCRKHKINLNAKYELNDESFNVDITGGWEVCKEFNAVEVFKTTETIVKEIKGSK